MPRSTNPQGYAPPISLRDIVEVLSPTLFESLIAELPGAVPIEAKANEAWRVAFGKCLIIGYTGSAVVSGTDAAQMRVVADRIRQAARLTSNQELAAREAAATAIAYINQYVGRSGSLPDEAIALLDLVDVWGALGALGAAHAYRYMAESLADANTQTWYCGVIRSILSAYAAGLDAGLDSTVAAEEWPTA